MTPRLVPSERKRRVPGRRRKFDQAPAEWREVRTRPGPKSRAAHPTTCRRWRAVSRCPGVPPYSSSPRYRFLDDPCHRLVRALDGDRYPPSTPPAAPGSAGLKRALAAPACQRGQRGVKALRERGGGGLGAQQPRRRLEIGSGQEGKLAINGGAGGLLDEVLPEQRAQARAAILLHPAVSGTSEGLNPGGGEPVASVTAGCGPQSLPRRPPAQQGTSARANLATRVRLFYSYRTGMRRACPVPQALSGVCDQTATKCRRRQGPRGTISY
jgi:hypothetical protein